MFEADARKKWCPFSRVARITYKPANNRTPKGIAEGSTCVGSDCMAWRWDFVQRGEPASGHCGCAGSPFPPVVVSASGSLGKFPPAPGFSISDIGEG